MQITVGNQLRIDNPTDQLLAWCKQQLVLTNPEYTKKKRMGFWVGNTPEKLYLYQWDGDTLVFPFGCLRTVMGMTNKRDSVRLDMVTPIPIRYRMNIPLYDYQREAAAKMLEAQYGILQAPTGCGKTQIMLALAFTLGRRTLWIAHTKDLVKQSKDRAEMYIDKSLTGTITEGQVKIGQGITFATVQTLCNLDLNQYRNVWDCIICDEVHRVSGSPTNLTMYSKVLNSLAARHKYGMTATPERADGLIKATFALLGEVVYTVPREAVVDKIARVSILSRSTGVGLNRAFLDTDGTVIEAKLINYLAENVERNDLIVSDLTSNRSHYNLILSDRVGHLRYLMNRLPVELRNQSVMVDGGMTTKKAKAERERAIEDMRQGKKRYLFATYALAREGLDIPRLDRLYLTTPHQHSSVITQSIGRIARTFEDKGEPIAYDYVDDGIQSMVKRYKKRCTTYRKQGCKFIEEVSK